MPHFILYARSFALNRTKWWTVCTQSMYYIYSVVAMPVICIPCIIHGMYDNNEVHFHKFPCAVLLLPLASYFIVLTNVNLV